MRSNFYKWYWFGVMLCAPLISQAASTEWKTALALVFGIVMAVVFVLLAIRIVHLFLMYRAGDNVLNELIITSLAAVAVALVGALFGAMGMGGAVIEPSY